MHKWRRGDMARAVIHDTAKWVKVKIRQAMVWNEIFGDYPCDGLSCRNRIGHQELHGGAKNLHFCLDCCHPVQSAMEKKGHEV
jgi:hypothetical protein